jgi:hypothetical protein
MKKKMTIYVAVLFVTFLFSNCSNKPNGLYEFISSSGEVKSINIVTDSTAIISSSASGIGINVKYKIEKKFITFYDIPYLGQAVAEITKEGIKMPSGELFVKKAESSVKAKTSVSTKSNMTSDKISDSALIDTAAVTQIEEEINEPRIENNDKNVAGSDKDIEQSEYDNEILGTWSGTLSGSNLATKKLVVMITKSIYNKQKKFGNVEGYSTVNNTNKTPLIGTFFVDADTPVLELNEPKTSGTNGTFKISSLTCDDYGTDPNKICGTWSSYNGQIQREVRLKRMN